jgi:hypothetical protein
MWLGPHCLALKADYSTNIMSLGPPVVVLDFPRLRPSAAWYESFLAISSLPQFSSNASLRRVLCFRYQIYQSHPLKLTRTIRRTREGLRQIHSQERHIRRGNPKVTLRPPPSPPLETSQFENFGRSYTSLAQEGISLIETLVL